MAAAVTGWVTVAVLVVGGTVAAAAAATPVRSSPAAPAVVVHVEELPATVVRVEASTGAAVEPLPASGRDDREPPVPGRPVRRFEPPPHEYGPGHRGVDLAAAPGTVVRSPADGAVRFAGPVAGRGVVVVEHADDTLTSLEPVDALLPTGTPVARGQPVARVQAAPRHPGCTATAGCLHWGARVDGRYVDPWWWLGRAGPVRLLPLG